MNSEEEGFRFERLVNLLGNARAEAEKLELGSLAFCIEEIRRMAEERRESRQLTSTENNQLPLPLTAG